MKVIIYPNNIEYYAEYKRAAINEDEIFYRIVSEDENKEITKMLKSSYRKEVKENKGTILLIQTS